MTYLCFVSWSEYSLKYLSWVKHAFRGLQSLPWSKDWGLFSWCNQAPINTCLTSYELYVQFCCRLLVRNKPSDEIRHVIFPVVCSYTNVTPWYNTTTFYGNTVLHTAKTEGFIIFWIPGAWQTFLHYINYLKL